MQYETITETLQAVEESVTIRGCAEYILDTSKKADTPDNIIAIMDAIHSDMVNAGKRHPDINHSQIHGVMRIYRDNPELATCICESSKNIFKVKESPTTLKNTYFML